jgi:hypothetical protein
MAIDYFDTFEAFELPACDAKTASRVRAALIDSLEECEIEVPADDLGEEELLDMPGYVLFAWLYDNDLSLSLFAIPESELSGDLRAALETANGKAYAYRELMIGDASSQAFARIDAAIGLDEFEDYLEDFEENVEGFGDTVAESDRDFLAGYRVAYFEDGERPRFEGGAFDRRFVSSSTVRRCQ